MLTSFLANKATDTEWLTNCPNNTKPYTWSFSSRALNMERLRAVFESLSKVFK